jgi:hypothetical protein
MKLDSDTSILLNINDFIFRLLNFLNDFYIFDTWLYKSLFLSILQKLEERRLSNEIFQDFYVLQGLWGLEIWN